MNARASLAQLPELLRRRKGEPLLEDPGPDRTELVERRDGLAERFAELQWDLGGLTYEMAIRDHFRLDVLVGQAAKLQEVDAELSAVERLLRMDKAGAVGSCSACGALHAHGALFCWQCGKDLVQRGPVSAEPAK